MWWITRRRAPKYAAMELASAGAPGMMDVSPPLQVVDRAAHQDHPGGGHVARPEHPAATWTRLASLSRFEVGRFRAEPTQTHRRGALDPGGWVLGAHWHTGVVPGDHPQAMRAVPSHPRRP